MDCVINFLKLRKLKISGKVWKEFGPGKTDGPKSNGCRPRVGTKCNRAQFPKSSLSVPIKQKTN